MSEEAPKQPQQPVPPPQENKEQPPAQNPPKETKQPKRPPYTGYKLYEHTQFQTGKQLRQARQKAILFKEVSFALFGRRRFKRVDLICTLNNFYNALSFASIFHRRVAGLYLIIELEKVQYTEFADEKDTVGEVKDHSIFRLTLTRYPTEKDRASIGFNEANKLESISQPITGLPERKQRRKNQNPNRKYERKGKRQEREHEPKERKDKEHQPRERRQREDTKRKDRDYNDRERKREPERNQSYNQRDNQKGRDENRDQRGLKREKDQYKDRTQRRNYREREEDRSYQKETAQYSKPQRSYHEKEQNTYYEKEHQKTYQEKSYREKQGESRHKEKRQDEGNYRRGETKSRGTGRVAGHNYEPSHIRTEDRGQRRPKRYRIDEDDN